MQTEPNNVYLIPHNQEALNMLEFRNFTELPPAMSDKNDGEIKIIVMPDRKEYFAFLSKNTRIAEKLIYSILGKETIHQDIDQLRKKLDNGRYK